MLCAHSSWSLLSQSMCAGELSISVIDEHGNELSAVPAEQLNKIALRVQPAAGAPAVCSDLLKSTC